MSVAGTLRRCDQQEAPREDNIADFILLPRSAEELSTPFVASGGIADGRSLMADSSLDADDGSAERCRLGKTA